ncbi:NAD(P)-dependent alcohol dehydrogenase [Budvicia diplopodorum]|uniref:NAD(P)-dependent alcohol dehydrogenase n=1 Tax=Budvicia diplopodorum TaxID=1119056 RepID=UPI00135A9AAE|nr:NAD(P)-dependent alcohol dehydrogenase [Budvicia diplopodorum]
MSMNIRSFAATAETAPVALHHIIRRDPRENDVVINIAYCGVCHSDIHQARNEWHNTIYPVVPGHEIIGQVTAVGTNVTKFKSGDWVGVGCMVDSCQHCASCAEGLEQFCENGATFTYNGKDRHDGSMTYGGYSEQIVVSDRFVLTLPEKLDPKSAAPLLCAGITTYSPLRHWNIGKGHKVAIVGLGGLGHMGVKFAKAMGADVTLFTRSAGKEQEALRLGADRVVLSTNPDRMKELVDHFDFILDTVPHQHDLNPYIAALKRDGVHVLVGLLEPIEPAFHSGPLVRRRKTLAGSLIGGIPETQEMLDFCAQHDITCDVEMINIQDINQAYTRMLKSDVKYRFVIDMKSIEVEA